MGAATLRRGRKEVHRPTRLPSVSGADHRRALTDLRREMGIEVLEAKKAGGYSQKDLDAAVSSAHKVAGGNLAVADAAFAELQKTIDEQAARIAELEGGVTDADADPRPSVEELQALNASDLIDHIQGVETVGAVEAIVAWETDGKSRKGVLKACAEHIDWLNDTE